ncbi:hypothetical protein [Cedratvirus kamchatka]|uniref:Uncharacterized protein n=1 Tax=Cedratvirus kamchatka TaxID=2716914 RepID=A0A6G8MZ05_9VIRU|nr:hypothetical protein [Cedratvirus kamchatka]WIL04258.1 hypothetical protein Clen_328 [Cedratvirus lena]
MAFQGVPLLLAQQVHSNTLPAMDSTRFNAYPTTDPYAFSAYTNLLTAYQEIEKASFAVDKRELVLRLEKAKNYLNLADDEVKQSTLSQFSSQIEPVSEELDNLERKARDLSSNDLPLFQTQDLRDYSTLLYPIIPSLERELASL